MVWEAAAAAAEAVWTWLWEEGFWQTVVKVYILSQASRALTRHPGTQGSGVISNIGRNVSVRQPISPWQVVIGQCRIGGDLTFVYLTEDKKYLHIIVTLGCHTFEEIGDIWLDDEVIKSGMIDSNGFVISGRFVSSNPTMKHNVGLVESQTFTLTNPVSSIINVFLGTDDPDFNNFITTCVDVSPATPAAYNEYKRVGTILTFHASAESIPVNVDYYTPNLTYVTRIKKELGDTVGQPFPDLVNESEGKWTDLHKQTGHAKIYIRFDASFLQNSNGGGVPNISAVVRGLKTYDPRTGTVHWTPNPPLVRLTYLTNTEWGIGADISEMSTSEFGVAADIAEERVLLSDASTTFSANPVDSSLLLADGSRLPLLGDGIRVSTGGSLPSPLVEGVTYYPFFPPILLEPNADTTGTLKLASSYANALVGTAIAITTVGSGTHTLIYYDEPRYRANGSFRLSERPVDILERLLAADAGTLTQTSNVWRTFAGAYEAPTITLDETHFAGAMHIERFPPRAQWANGAKGVFISPAANWQQTDFPPIEPTDPYLAEDGGEKIWIDMDLTSFVTSSAQAQRLATIEVRRRRSSLTVSAPFNLSTWRVATGRTVALTFDKYGWTAKPFTIVEATLSVAGGDKPVLLVNLALRETNSAIYDWNADDLPQPTPPATNLPSPFKEPDVVTGLSAQSGTEFLYRNSDGTVITRVNVTWNVVTDGIVLNNGHIELSFKRVAETVFSNTVQLPPDAVQAYLNSLEDLATYTIRIRLVSAFGIVGASTTITHQVIGKSAPPLDVSGLSFADPILSWSPNADIDLKGYVVRYQDSGSDDWNTATPAHSQGFITETRLDVWRIIQSGSSTRLLVKAIDTSDNLSEVATSLVVDLNPPTVSFFVISAQPDGTRELAWSTASPPNDFAGVEIRYLLGATSNWDAMTLLHTGLLIASPFETNQLAAGTYTFAIKNVDTGGNKSTSVRFIDNAILPDPRIAGSLEDIIEEPTWTGTKVNCHISGAKGWLIADDSGDWTDPATWAAMTSWISAPISPITYTRSIDIGTVTSFVPLVTVIGDETITIEESHSDDDMAYSSFAAVGPQITARYIDIRVTSTGTFPKLKSMRTILSAKITEEIIGDLDTSTLTDESGGGWKIPFATPFTVIKKVDVTLQNVGQNVTCELIDKQTVWIRIWDNNGTPTQTDALIDVSIKGIV